MTYNEYLSQQEAAAKEEEREGSCHAGDLCPSQSKDGCYGLKLDLVQN